MNSSGLTLRVGAKYHVDLSTSEYKIFKGDKSRDGVILIVGFKKDARGPWYSGEIVEGLTAYGQVGWLVDFIEGSPFHLALTPFEDLGVSEVSFSFDELIDGGVL